MEAGIQQKMVKVTIPDELAFSDLHLSRDPDGSVSFDWSVIERICDANDLPVEMFRDEPEEQVCHLLVRWYQEHRQLGGEPDPVAEDLEAEVVAEEKAGQTVSYSPGRA